MTEGKDVLAKNDAFERALKVKLEVYNKSKELLNLHPDKFAFNAFKNDYYKGLVSVASQITSEKGSYTLILSFNKERNPEKDAVEMILLQPSAGKTVYRMDIKSGQETEKELEDVEERIRELGVSNEAANSVRQFMKSRGTKIDGISTVFDSGWAETELTDEQALEILNTATGFEIPFDWRDRPSWDKIQSKKSKLDLPKRMLT